MPLEGVFVPRPRAVPPAKAGSVFIMRAFHDAIASCFEPQPPFGLASMRPPRIVLWKKLIAWVAAVRKMRFQRSDVLLGISHLRRLSRDEGSGCEVRHR